MYSLVRLHLHTTCITSSIDKLIFYQFSLTYNFNSMNPINDATPDEVAMTISLSGGWILYFAHRETIHYTFFSVTCILCDTGTMLYQLGAGHIVSSQYTRRWWRIKKNYGRSYIWTAAKDMKIRHDWSSQYVFISFAAVQIYNLSDTRTSFIFFHIFICILHLLRVYYKLTMWPAP